jgi:hypothetical protein
MGASRPRSAAAPKPMTPVIVANCSLTGNKRERSAASENLLVKGVEQIRNAVTTSLSGKLEMVYLPGPETYRWVANNTLHADICQVADEDASSLREGQGVAPEEPLKDDQTNWT